MCIPIGGSSSEGGSPMQNCLQNTRLQVIMLLVGAILVGGGIALTCLSYPGVPMGTIGGVVISLGMPFLTYGLFMLIYNKCVLKQQKPKPINDPLKTEKKKSSCFKKPRFMQKGQTLSSNTKATTGKPPLECHLDFDGKMKAIYSKFESTDVVSKLSKKAEALTLSDLSGKEAIKGVDSENRNFLAIKRDEKTLWVFAENSAGNKVTFLHIINKGTVTQSSPFTNESELNAIKETLQ